MAWLRYSIFVILFLFILLIAGIFVAINLVDSAEIKALATKQVEKATGRTLAINAPIEITFTPMPTIRLGRVSLSNADWATRSAAMIRADKIDVSLAIPALLQGDIAIHDILIEKAIIHLQTNKQGEHNWEFGKKKTTKNNETASQEPIAPNSATNITTKTEPSKSLPININTITLREVTVHYHNHNQEATYKLDIAELMADISGNNDAPRIDAKLTYNGMHLHPVISAQSIDDLLTGTVNFQLTGNDSNTRINTNIDLSVKENTPHLSGTASIKGASLAALNTLTGQTLPATPGYSISTELKGTPDAMEFEKLRIEYDTLYAQGKGSVKLNGVRPRIGLSLATSAYNITANNNSPTPEEGSDFFSSLPALISSADAAQQTQRLFPSTPLPLDILKTIDGTLHWTVGTLTLPSLTAKDLTVHATLDNGVFSADPITFSTAGGKINSTLRLNSNASPANIQLTLLANDVIMETLLQNIPSDSSMLKGGKTDLQLNLTGSGNNIAAIVSSADGNMRLLVDDVTYNNPQIKQAERFMQLLQAGKTEGALALTCAFTDLDIRNGVGATRAMTLQTDAARVDGKGQINFAQESLSLSLKAKSNQVGIADLVPPLKIKGPWAAPSVALDSTNTLLNVGKLALGVGTGGLGFAALAGVEASDKAGLFASDNPCIQQALNPQQPEKTDLNKDGQPKSSTEKIEDNVRKQIKAKEQDVKATRDAVKDNVKKIEDTVKGIRDALEGF